MSISKPATQAGFSLVELSVAAAIFSMGLGSMSMLLLTAIHGTSEARHQSMASLQADSLAEMIAMSSDAYGHYVDPVETAAALCAEAVCAAHVMATDNLAHWQSSLGNELPDGKGIVCRDSSPDDGDLLDPSCDGNGALVIKVFWTEPSHETPGGQGQKRLVTRLAW